MLEPELFHWAEEHVDLLRWLMIADKKIDHGTIVIRYHQGKITGYDICPRIRTDLRKNNIIK